MNSFAFLINYIDGLFIGGFFLICLSGLSLISYYGGFDIFSYVAYGKRKYNNCTLYDYSQIQKNSKDKKGAKKFFIPYLVVGLIFVAIAAFLLIFI